MGLQWQKPGLQHTGEYLSSGHAYIVARGNTTREITLNFIPSEITIINESATHPLEVEIEDSTSPTTVKRSFHVTKGSHTIRIKCKKIKFVVSDSSQYHSAVIACTSIPASGYTPPIYDNLGRDTP